MITAPKTLGKYQIVGLVGRGGMGEVFKAFQPDLNRHVAIKTMLAGEQASEEFLRRFQREARTAAGLVHPNIVQIYDFGAEGKLHYIVMEFVEGRSLNQIMAEKKLGVQKSLRIAHTVARTLQFAHDRQIIHRDIKPANVLIDRQGRVRILDFGMAKSLADGKGLTLSGVMVGTPHYMAPEQAFGAPEEVDARADLYSLGAMLYEMLAGRRPFDAATVLGILRKLEEEDPAPPGVSPAVDALVLKALAKDRERRFQSAGQMADAIKACLSGSEKSEVTGPAGPLTQVRPAARGLRLPWAAAALVAAGLFAWMVWRPTPAAAPPDLEAELRALLARKPDPADDELTRFSDPKLRQAIAQHRMKRGQFSRASADLEGYEKFVCDLASASTLQRFVSPGLFPPPPPEAADLKGAPAFLMQAVQRHWEGKQEAAREKLNAAAAAGAPAAHVALVRAHLDLWDVWPDPASEASKALLAALRDELQRHGELALLPLRAVAAHLAGDARGAWEAADRLRAAAPDSAETYLLRAILHQRDGRFDLAADLLDDAVKFEPTALETELHTMYLQWVEFLYKPDDGNPDFAQMRTALDARLQQDDPPAGLLLRGFLNALESRWDEAEQDLARLSKRTSLDRATADHERLWAFVFLGGRPRSHLLAEARELQALLGRAADALVTAELVGGDDLAPEERDELLRQNHRRIAHLCLSDEPKAMRHLEEALKLGLDPQQLRDDEALGQLRERPAFEALLKRHER
jgi:tRNA A-37 threonylcarbamoyl transferase component Bud32